MRRNLRFFSAVLFGLIMLSVLFVSISGASAPPQINIDATTLPTFGDVGQSFPISVPISDDTGVSRAEVVYTPVGSSESISLNMNLSDGDAKNGIWSATIPAQSRGGVLEFHISAYDNEGLSSRYPVDDEQEIFIGATGTVPEVLYTYPKNKDIVDPATFESIKIGFNTEMNRSSVEEAVSISPSLATEKFIWSDNGTEVIIPLSSALTPGTNYTVTISSSAKSHEGTPMNASYSFRFYSLEDFSGHAGWDPMVVSMASIVVLLLIALLLFRGLTKRNSGEKRDEDKARQEKRKEED